MRQAFFNLFEKEIKAVKTLEFSGQSFPLFPKFSSFPHKSTTKIREKRTPKKCPICGF